MLQLERPPLMILLNICTHVKACHTLTFFFNNSLKMAAITEWMTPVAPPGDSPEKPQAQTPSLWQKWIG